MSHENGFRERLRRATTEERRQLILELSKDEKQSLFDLDYFNSGSAKRISGYSNLFASEHDILRKIEASSYVQIFRPRRALDLGCANGLLVKDLVDLGVDAYGVDISESAIELSPVRRLLRCVDIDREKLPFDDEYFDLVISRQTMEHVCVLDSALAQISRVLAWGGCFVFDVPRPSSGYARLDVTHVNIWTQDTWVREVSRCGLRYDSSFDRKQFLKIFAPSLAEELSRSQDIILPGYVKKRYLVLFKVIRRIGPLSRFAFESLPWLPIMKPVIMLRFVKETEPRNEDPYRS